jgi:hypothetical protein
VTETGIENVVRLICLLNFCKLKEWKTKYLLLSLTMVLVCVKPVSLVMTHQELSFHQSSVDQDIRV